MNFPLPWAVFLQHIALLGKTGSGKSSVMRLMVEHLLDKQEPVCTVDPKGDWWGLKSSADGRRAGYPIVIFGGEHADVPLNPRSGVAVAELAATGNRPCIIDLGGWMPGARTEFWLDFAPKFFVLSRGRRWLVIDEVHNFCPKGKIMDPNAGKMLHWTNRLASEGRGKGINLIAASQRPQKVHNDFLTSCETLVAMRVLHKADRDAVKDWIDGCGDPEKGKELLANIAQMKRGEGWAWSPEAEFGPKHIHFPLFSTYDSFAPQNASGPVKLKGWADVDLAEVTKKLEAAVKEHEANDPKKLQAKVRELQAQLARAAVNKPLPIVKEKLTPGLVQAEKRLRQILGEAMKIIVKVQAFGFDKAGVKPAEIEKAFNAAASEVMKLAKLAMDRRSTEFDKLKKEAATLLGQMKRALGKEDLTVDVHVQHNEPFTVRPTPLPPKTGTGSTWNGEPLPEGEKATLIAVGQHEGGVTRPQLTVLTGYARSTRDAYLSRLKAKDLWQDSRGRIVITQDGIQALGDDYNPVPSTGKELQAYWMGKLPVGEKRILELLIAANGVPVQRDSLDQATGFARSSRDAYLSRLAAKELVETNRGEVNAAATLFAE